jgi:hypothetical protein
MIVFDNRRVDVALRDEDDAIARSMRYARNGTAHNQGLSARIIDGNHLPPSEKRLTPLGAYDFDSELRIDRKKRSI